MESPTARARTTTLLRYQRLAAQGNARLLALLRLAARALHVANVVLGRVDPVTGALDTLGGLVGVDAGAAPMFVPLCQHALGRAEVFSVADARGEEGLRALPLITSGAVRHVAGAALRGDDGALLGAFVALEPAPREVTRSAREVLALTAETLARHLAEEREFEALRARHAEHLRDLDVLRGVFRGARRFAIVTADPDGRVTRLNEGAASLLQRPALPGELALESLFSPTELAPVAARLGLPDSPAGRSAALASLAGRDEGDSRDWTWRRADGSPLPVHATLHAVVDEDQSLRGYVAVAQDITERLAVERLKDDFIAAVSHELRTPLTSIRGAVGLLGGGVAGPLAGDAAELVAVAEGQCLQLERLVDDLLDLARLRAGRFELRRSECLLGALVHNALAAHGPYAATLGVSLAAADDPDSRAAAGARVVVDPDRVLQVLANLLSNAAKFSPPGAAVTVRMRRAGASVRVLVEDHGAGIPEALQPHVFERFMHAEPPGVLGARARGTGLGLGIAKGLVERHGGAIGFESVVGRGSTFWFDLPTAEAAS